MTPVPSRNGGLSQRWRCASSANAKATAKPRTTEIATSSTCWTAGETYSPMLSFAQPKQKRASPDWHGSVSEVRSLKKPSPTSPTAASGSASTLVMRTLHGAVLLDLCVRRGEELGDDLDREHAVDPPFAIGDRCILRLSLEQVGERVAHHVVAIEQRTQRRVGLGGHGLGGEVALGEPAQRSSLGVDQ